MFLEVAEPAKDLIDIISVRKVIWIHNNSYLMLMAHKKLIGLYIKLFFSKKMIFS